MCRQQKFLQIGKVYKLNADQEFYRNMVDKPTTLGFDSFIKNKGETLQYLGIEKFSFCSHHVFCHGADQKEKIYLPSNKKGNFSTI